MDLCLREFFCLLTENTGSFIMRFLFFSTASSLLHVTEGLCSADDFKGLKDIDISATLDCESPFLSADTNDTKALINCMQEASVSEGCANAILSDFAISSAPCPGCLPGPDYGDACLSCITTSAIQAISKNAPSELAGDCSGTDAELLGSLNFTEVLSCSTNYTLTQDCFTAQANVSDKCYSSILTGLSDITSDCDSLCNYLDDPKLKQACNHCLWLSFSTKGAIALSSTLYSAEIGVLSAIYNYLSVLFGYSI